MIFKGLQFDEVQHRYTLNGKPLPSVTSVISTVSADSILSNNFKMAGIRGTAVHSVCDKLNRNEQVNISSLDQDIDRYVQGYILFLQAGLYEVTHSEIRVYSPTKHYAGTVDIIAKDKKGNHVVMDIKTSALVSPTASLQMAAYAGAIEELAKLGEIPDLPKNIKIKERVVIWLTGDGKYQLVKYKDPNDYSVFVCHLVCHNWRRKHDIN